MLNLSGKPPTLSDELQDSERRFRLLVEGVSDCAIYMLNPSGAIASWNVGAQRITGYKADEAIGRHFGMLHMPEDQRNGLPDQALRTALTEGKYEAEGWQLRKDGTRFRALVVIDPIYENGELAGFAQITRDVTERHAAQAALQESERHFRMLVSGVTDYALYMLDPQGYVTSWNIGGERIKGYSPSEIIGKHFSRFYTEQDRENGKPARALATALEHGRYEEEGWRVRKDGSFFWASVVIDPIRDDSGELAGFAKITRDITERRNAHLELERVQKQLAEAQKLDALGQLTGGVAHDFNNLLMIVSGNVQRLKPFVAQDPKAARAAQAIETASERGASLTRQLLTFARRQRVNPQAVSLIERIQSIRDVLVSGIGTHVGLEIESPPQTWPVIVDVGELEVALVNLVLNARDAMPEGGTITISARNSSLPPDEVVTGGDYVMLTVKDTGIGIAPDVLAKVFEPFFTTKPVGRGTGLGLSQVHGFAHQAGGTVRISSELGKGTEVAIYLPRAIVCTIEEREETGPTQSVHSGTVLLVEDNPDVANASTGLLEQLGYSVQWATDAESALKAIESDGFALVLSDIVMPGRIDGIGLAKTIRQKRPSLPIVLATGYSDAVHNAPPDFPILRKPYQMHELSQAITRASATRAR